MNWKEEGREEINSTQVRFDLSGLAEQSLSHGRHDLIVSNLQSPKERNES
jgi:hypothetical protein